jgi:glycosyltransferase involved in cell wall biosynthesis
MKIIVVGTRGFPNIQGGIEKHCEQLYPRLVELGCQVTVLGRSPYTGKKSYKYQGVTIFPIACPKHKFLETILHTFLGILKAKQLGADILHIHAIGPSLLVPFARLLRLKVVMTHHGPDYERQKWNQNAKRILRLGEKWGVVLAHQVIAVSQTIAKSVLQKFDREVIAIPNGVIVCERANQNGVLKRYELEPGKYFLAVGRFVPEKGFHDLLESFHQFLSMTHNPWKLVIVGDADHEDAFSRKLKKQSRGMPGVVLTGFQSGITLQVLYSQAGLFILPSYHEGLPIVLLEALSYGSSCLVSDIPANREVNLEEDRYFKPGDIDRITQKLSEFWLRPDTEDERRKRIQQITDKYNWAQIAQKTLEVYKRIDGVSVEKIKWSVESKRIFPRVDLNVEARVETRASFSSSEKIENTYHISNISLGGVCINSPIAEGSFATLNCRHPQSGAVISAMGKVVWNNLNQSKCGMEFRKLNLTTSG